MIKRFSSFPVIIIFAVILLLAFGLRSYALEADAPHHLSVSQGLTTDGANTVFAGRNMALFGRWSPELEGFTGRVPAVSAINLLSYSIFSLLGIGYWQGGLLAVFIALLTISVVAAFARQHFGNRVALFTTLFLTINYAYLIYSRLPVAFTMVGLVMALILFCLGRGPSNTGFLALSIALTILSIIYVKIAVIAAIPMVVVGVAIVIYGRYPSLRANKTRLFLLILLLTILAALFLIVSPRRNLFLVLAQEGAFNMEYGIAENIRFLVTSLLEFGIYSAFFIRIMPLFLLSFGYVLFRAAQFSSKKLTRLPLGEILALMLLFGVAGMLLLSNQQPTRHLILIIPPMSLIGALAIEKMLQSRRFAAPSDMGYVFPIVVFLGLTYLIYQLLAAVYRGITALRFGANIGDYSTITPMPALHAIIFISLVPAFLITFLILAYVSGSGRWLNSFLSRVRLRIMIVFLMAVLISTDVIQYALWARSPEYSIVDASRQVREDFGEGVVLGGAYAAVLGLENDYPGIVFFEEPLRNPGYQQRVVDSELTHLAMEAESIFGDIPINDQVMRENVPEFYEHLELANTYYVRGYYVKVYKIE
jgi:hypothetical protein